MNLTGCCLCGPVRDRSYFTAVPSRVATFCEITLHPSGGVVVASPFQLGKFGLDRSWPWIWPMPFVSSPFLPNVISWMPILLATAGDRPARIEVELTA